MDGRHVRNVGIQIHMSVTLMELDDLNAATQDALPRLGLNPLKATEGEQIPHGMVRKNRGILINLGSKAVQIDQVEIQPRDDYLTQHTLIGKFIGRRFDVVTQNCWLTVINAILYLWM